MATTLANLRTYVRQQADQESSTFISDSELNRYINQGGTELHGLLSTLYEDYYLTSVNFTLSTANTYTLPANFFKLRGLDYSNAGDWITVPRFSFEERNKWQNRYSLGDLQVWRAYRLMQGAIYVLPEDDYAGNYRLWYLYGYTPMASDSDTLSDLMGWDEYVVLYAALKCLKKEESDSSALQMDLEKLKQRIQAEASNRDAAGPEKIHVASGTDDWWSDTDTWGR